MRTIFHISVSLEVDFKNDSVFEEFYIQAEGSSPESALATVREYIAQKYSTIEPEPDEG